MKIINLTPQVVNVLDRTSGDLLATFQKSDKPARVSQTVKNTGTFAGVPLTSNVFGDVHDLPENEDLDQSSTSVLFIVSMMVKLACPERNDLVSPNELVRDAEGNILGCNSLC